MCLSIMGTWRLNTFWKLNAITDVPLDFKKPSLAWRKHVIIPHWRGAPVIKWTCYFPGRWTIIKRNLSVRICNHRTQERWHERSWHSGSGNGTKPTATGGASRAAWKATRLWRLWWHLPLRQSSQEDIIRITIRLVGMRVRGDNLLLWHKYKGLC